MNRAITTGALLVGLMLAFAPADACQLQYTGKAASMFGSTPRGSFSGLNACNNYRNSRPAFESNNSHCVGCSNSSSSGGYRNSNDFAMQMFGNMFGSMLEGILNPPQQDTSYQQQQLLNQQIEKQKQAALKKQAEERLKALKKEEELRKTQEEAQRKDQGGRALAKMMNIDGSPRKNTKATLTPFKWDTPKLEAKPIGTGKYDTSGYTSWQRMICAAHFSSKALEVSRGGDAEGAVFMNSQSDKVTAGEMTDVECQMSGLQQLADVQRQNFKENISLTKMVKLVPIIQEKVKHLQQVEMNLHEAQEEKKEAEIKLEEAEVKVEEAKTQAESAQTPEEVAQADDLLQLALALQDEGTAQLEEANQAEEEYALLKEKGLSDLRDLKEKLTGGLAHE